MEAHPYYWLIRSFMAHVEPMGVKSVRAVFIYIRFVPVRTLQRWLHTLVCMGILKRSGKSRATVYELTDAARELLDEAWEESADDRAKWARWNPQWSDSSPLHPCYERAILRMLQGELRVSGRSGPTNPSDPSAVIEPYSPSAGPTASGRKLRRYLPPWDPNRKTRRRYARR